jgi:hypothetical protein
MITASAAVGDDNLLGRAFRGASWSAWRAAEGLPLDDDRHPDFCRVGKLDSCNT